MAEYSYNGWLASRTPADFGGLEKLIVAGESFSPGVRSGDVHTVFQYVAEQLHSRVEPVVKEGWHQADDWGWSYRQNRNANNLSCHSSGTAFDYNATRHPNGVHGTFSPSQVTEIHRILGEVNNVVKWGGVFSGTKDEMHFEIHATAAEVATVASRLRGGGAAPTRKSEMNLENTLLHPTGTEKRAIRLNCPTGSASALIARAWISAAVIGPGVGWVHFWFQGDFGGIGDAERSINFQDGRSDRVWAELPDGTTTINIEYMMPNGGVITLETMGK